MKIKFTSIKKLLTTKLILIAMLSAVATFCIYSNNFSLTSNATGNFESLSETETDSFFQSYTENIDMEMEIETEDINTEIDLEIEPNMFRYIDVNDLSFIEEVMQANLTLARQINQQVELDLMNIIDEENQADNTNILDQYTIREVNYLPPEFIDANLNERQNPQMDEYYIIREINYLPPELLPNNIDEALDQYQKGMSESNSETSTESKD